MSQISEEAAGWFVRNRATATSSEERTAFIAWLKSSPLHIEEYLKISVTSRDLKQMARSMHYDIDTLVEEARADNIIRPMPPHIPARSVAELVGNVTYRWTRLTRLAALAAGLLLIITSALWFDRDGQRFGLPKQFITVHGEQGSWLLPDGTGMSLNSDSAATVHFTRRERLVTVDRGQALFQVAHESARRFRVTAGNTAVIAIGTQFDVFRQADATQITVVEGKVAVFTGTTPMSGRGASLPVSPQATAVSAGEQVRVNDRMRTATPRVVNVQQAVAWIQRQVVFEERPLGEVAAEFNRYGAVPIVVDSDSLRELPISGVFNAYDTDSFLAFVAKIDRVHIERSSERISIQGDAPDF